MSKVWFITGASSGIGAVLPGRHLKAGDRVVATARNLGKVRSALRDVADENVAFVQRMLPARHRQKAAVEDAVKQFGRIDVAVKQCGLRRHGGNFEELPIADIEQQFANELLGCGAHHARGAANHAQAAVRPHF